MRIRLDLVVAKAGGIGWRSEVHPHIDAALSRWYSTPPRSRRGGYLSDADSGRVRLPFSWEMASAPLLATRAVCAAHADRISTVPPDRELNAEYLIVERVWVGAKAFPHSASLDAATVGSLRARVAGAGARQSFARPVAEEPEEAEWEEVVRALPVPDLPLLPPPGPPGAAGALAAISEARTMADLAGEPWRAALEEARAALTGGGEAAAAALVRLAGMAPDDFRDAETAARWAMTWRREWLRVAARIRQEALMPARSRFVLHASGEAAPAPRAAMSVVQVVRFVPPSGMPADREGPLGTAGLSRLGRAVVVALGGSRPLRKADVARLVGVGRGSANRIVDALVDAGWLSESSPGLYGIARE